MLRRLFLALLLATSPVFAAVDTPDAVTFEGLTVDAADPELTSHTVTSGTTLLLVAFGHKANECETVTVTWNGNSMASIADVDDSVNTGDVTVQVFGLLSPTPATGNISVDCEGVINTWYWVAGINFTGTTTSVLGTTVSVKSTDLNNGNGGTGTTATNVHASAGTSGNALLFVGTQHGADGLPVSNDATFTELIEQETGGGATNAADATAYIAEKLSGLPSAITVTFNQDDDNVGILLEIEAASTAPSFTSGPTVSAATNGYTISGTLTGSGTLTAYAVACHPSAADASAAQIKAGNCAGPVTANIAANEVWATGVGDSFALTESGAYPRAKVCVVGSNGSSDTSVTCSTANRSADSGQALVTLASVATTSIFDDDAYYDPDVAANDVAEYDTLSSIGCTIAFETDGDFTVAVSAEVGCDTAGELDDRQNFDYNIQDVSATSDFSAGPPTWATGDDTVWINNSAPQCDAFDPDPLILDEDNTISSIDLDDFVTDADSDQPTYTVTSGTLPTGLTLTGATGVLSFTYSVEDEAGDAIVFTATDVAGDTCTLGTNVYVVDTWTMPDITGDTVVAAETTIIAAAPWRVDNLTISVSFSCHESVAENDIISQTPTASSEVDDANGAITAVVSTGICLNGRRTKGVTLPGVSIGQ